MRFFLLLLFSCTIATVSLAQDSTISLSAFETFSSRSGRILKTQIIEFGTVGGYAVDRIRTIDVANMDTAQAMRINYNFLNNQLPLIHPGVLYIDMADLDTVIKALTYFLEGATEKGPTTRALYSYITSTDLHVFAEYETFSGMWRFGLRKVYQKLRTPVPATSVSWNRKRANELLQLLIQAKSTRW